MATKAEEVNTTPTEAAGPVGSATTEKQAETVPVVESAAEKDQPVTEKTGVEDATAAVAELSVADKDVAVKKTEEDAAAAVTASAPKTTTDPAPSANGPTWPETSPDHPLTKFFDLFETLVTEAGHNEVYGVELSKSNPFHTKLILQKFLRANQNDLEKAKLQLLETLKFRKEFDPVKAAGESFEQSRFGGLGYILEVEGVPESPNKKDIVTFNIYGAVKDNKATFGDLDGFLRWRVGLMEKSVQKLNLSSATEPIPNYNEGPDPYQGFQIHDYLQVSFLRQDPHVKAATKKTIEILGRHYPETLSRKFFVNVPVVMGWLYSAMKMVIAKETVKKFTVLSYGNQLATELGPNIPKVYGGTTGDLGDVGEGVKFTE
ncbi:Non-classical phosphatidylinositol transfer protein (PITP) [Neocucurbitaria cava]|uniref:Phosphatidylinositol transfer protein SFH5 n=1 Tax=Neocucurbitaria cava TaxID=798079 RepID=A0A9W9CS16_9PLEO|nr:Non-classical phosphatidylinositol transfer protein (PITP) [Neocucurbitaria cava]